MKWDVVGMIGVGLIAASYIGYLIHVGLIIR
jgi:hypothetical protein